MNTEPKGWCIKRYSGGCIGYSSTHRFTPYNTLILRRLMYYCACGKKISQEEYGEYSRYLIARDKAVEKWYAEKI